MTEQFGNADAALQQRIATKYRDRAAFITAKDLPGQKSMHATAFESIATDGTRHTQQRWDHDIELENRLNNYTFSVYSLEKIVSASDVVVVFATRKCAGTNNKGKAFNTEIRLRDEWISEGNELKIRLSETISRRVWLDGVEMSISQMRPQASVLVQGCGDYEDVS